MNIAPPSIHPFPARMAPSIALDFSSALPTSAIVLDPMVGSGTTIRSAIDSGHSAIGFDMDPLAVLISRAWTRPISRAVFERRAQEVLVQAKELVGRETHLPWIDDEQETRAFIARWFGVQQQVQLRALASVMFGRIGASWDLCRVAMSRIIITKDRGASLARDVSHSRPHIVMRDSDYDVFGGFERSAALLAARLDKNPIRGRAWVSEGDARELPLDMDSVDAVITSPPYLNAIDYMRGHKLSLVWLGYTIPKLRDIRGREMGAEKTLQVDTDYVSRTIREVGDVQVLEPRLAGMIKRYVLDCHALMASISRVLRPGGSALMVLGNSSLRGVLLRNDRAIELAGKSHGMKVVERSERALPENRRYLPPPSSGDGKLSSRMRTEIVLRFKNFA